MSRRALRQRVRPAMLGWLLGAATAVLVLVNQQRVGIARDEVVYMQAGGRYAAWWTGLFSAAHGISERAVTQTFGGPGPTDNNREHPALMKTLFGLSDRVLHQGLGVEEVTAFRVPAALLHGVLVAIVFGFVLELWGLAAAIAAALCLIGLPRAVFHAGLACFDAPIMTLWFATVVAYARAIARPRRWPWQVGVLWGLALATKHTALLLPFALGLHYLVVAWRATRPVAGQGGLARVRAVIGYRWRVIVSLAVLGPLTLYVVWPWLWFAPIAHVRDWLAFHLHHVHYNFEYLGRNWNAPRFPWHVALVTTLFTVPVATLAAAVIGGGVWIRQWRQASTPGAPDAPDAPGAPVLLLVLSLAASIGPFVLGSTPIFGAEKHWMPALPTIAIAAGVGIAWAGRQLAHWTSVAIATGVLTGLVALAAAAELSVAEPYALTWYNALAGGAPGGADLGMNRQFWGVAARGVLPVLDELSAAQPGTSYVYTHDASPAWATYQREGLVPRRLADAGMEQAGIDRSQLAIVIHELHFNRHDFLIWSSYGTVAPVFVLTSGGVPIVSVYQRPR